MRIEARINHPHVAHIIWNSEEQIERALLLNEIGRYSMFREMAHRTSVLAHSVRVMNHASIFAQILNTNGVMINDETVLVMADRHDDTEIITGDIPRPVKRKATRKTKKEIEQNDKAAAKLVEGLIAMPTPIPNYYPAIYKELKRRRTLEAKVVNFADKWDGLHEAVHEVVCGTNRKDFRKVIKEYKDDFQRLERDNRGWQNVVAQVLGDGIFTFPNSGTLKPKRVEDLDFSDPIKFIESIAEGNPRSYHYWLLFNLALCKENFLTDTFPGWIGKFPEDIMDDIKSLQKGEKFRQTASGLFVPRGSNTPTFSERMHNFAIMPNLGPNYMEIVASAVAEALAKKFIRT